MKPALRDPLLDERTRLGAELPAGGRGKAAIVGQRAHEPRVATAGAEGFAVDATVGDYGFDAVTGSAWAVLSPTTTASYSLIPEPTSALAGLLLGAGLLRRRRA